ncbi:hypothetical protein GGI07_001341 [Coemansia sp. Benny D115]|nr:hypothetical protein GGI07_001341 [Coemansia sp. Benny D115]
MALLDDARAAAQVCAIAQDLATQQEHILFTAPLPQRRPNSLTATSTSLLTAALSLWQKPAQALTHTFFKPGKPGSTSGLINAHINTLCSDLLGAQRNNGSRGMVCLAWDECRSLYHIFRALEYVDMQGKPTSLVDTFVSRLTAGEAAKSGETARSHGPGSAGEEHVRMSAWRLISDIFARATALRISAEAEEVSEADAQAVLTWFPQLEYLEIQSIPQESLRFWTTWLPPRLTSLCVRHAGVDLERILGLDCSESVDSASVPSEWARLLLLDLSGNPAIDLAPLSGPLVQKVPHIERLSLANCELEVVPDTLTLLYGLRWLDLHANSIAEIGDISLRLGSIVRLNLAQNRISNVLGLRRLWALEALDLSDNRLEMWSELLVLRNLPSLAELHIKGNPFTEDVAQQDYRPQLFSAFDHRDVALALDGTRPSAQERREMAKIPRVATGHGGGSTGGVVSKPVETPVLKQRRPKVAFIEESIDTDDSAAPGAAADAADDAMSVASVLASSPKMEAPLAEKHPRVLRATELQAVAVAAAHRRSNVSNSALLASSPNAHGTPMQKLIPLRRRATATTASGLLASPAGLQRQGTYSVPSSYSTRSGSGHTSMMLAATPDLARQSPAGFPLGRDPERYRRRVEMMRAEAGSSWLRAFAELQSQSASASPISLGSAHFETEHNGSVPVSAADTRSVHTLESSRVSSPEPSNASDTQLPSFLFPHRRNNLKNKKKAVSRLPHYSAEELQDAADSGKTKPSGKQQNQQEEKTAKDEDSLAGDPDVQPSSEKDQDTIDEQPQEAVSEVQRILNSDISARVVAEDTPVARYQLVSLAEVPLAAGQSAGSDDRAVQRIDCGQRTVVITQSSLIEIKEGAESERQNVVATTPLASIVRARKLANVAERLLVEVKGDRFDTPVWLELESTPELVSAVQLAVRENSARPSGSLEASVYKQAECLRCGWRDFADREHDVFDTLIQLPSGSKYALVESTPAELQCAKCGRRYLREFYAGDEAQNGDNSELSSGGTDWRQAIKARRNKMGTGTGSAAAAVGGKRDDLNGAAVRARQRAQSLSEAKSAALADIARMREAAVSGGSLAFAEASNSVRLYLQLSVFSNDGERLMLWVPAGLVRQSQPLVPADTANSAASIEKTGAAATAAAVVAAPSKWGLASLLGGSSGGGSGSQADAKEASPSMSPKSLASTVCQVSSDWRASSALNPALCEQAVFLALSSHALYVFSPTWAALDFSSVAAPKRAEIELQPERYLSLVFSMPLSGLGRIDIGPNRQYLALHSALLAAAETPAMHWGAITQKLISPPLHPAYPKSNAASGGTAAGDYVAVQHLRRNAALGGDRGAASSCVLMIRDRLACSDLLDALVEIGYETRVLDTGAGVGSGRLRAINHDVEWAMHHLVQQVFLRSGTFNSLDEEDEEDEEDSHRSDDPLRELVRKDEMGCLQGLRRELLRSPSSRQPGAMVDLASGDNVIIDKVTYEFLKLYFCVGLASSAGMQPWTLVGSPQFIYLVRERVDVWPPPVPDLHLLYSRWQRIAPPTIVTSDPDTYDPEMLAQELARRSNSTSVHSSISGADESSSERYAGLDKRQTKTPGDPLLSSLIATQVPQYDRVAHARPIADLRRIVLVHQDVAVVPRPQRKSEDAGAAHSGPKNAVAAAAAAAVDEDNNEETLGCAGSSWHAMLRVEFATTEETAATDLECESGDIVDAADGDGDRSSWRIWFATLASAQECAEALQTLATSAGVSGLVSFYESN